MLWMGVCVVMRMKAAYEEAPARSCCTASWWELGKRSSPQLGRSGSWLLHQAAPAACCPHLGSIANGRCQALRVCEVKLHQLQAVPLLLGQQAVVDRDLSALLRCLHVPHACCDAEASLKELPAAAWAVVFGACW